MNLADVMTRAVVTVHMDDSLQRIRDIFDSSRFHHLMVLDEMGKVVGVISDRDVLKNVSPFIGKTMMERGQDTATLRRRAHQIMHRRPVLARPEMDVDDAAELLMREGVECLPVVDKERRPVGIVSWRDLLKFCFACRRDDGAAPEAA